MLKNSMAKIILDIETTGFNAEKDDIIELAALKVNKDYLVEETFYHLLKPKKSIPPKIQRMTNLNWQNLKSKKSFEDIKDEFVLFVSKCPIFIYSKLDERFIDAKCNLGNRFVDILDIVKERYRSMNNHKFFNMCKRFKINVGKEHSAMNHAIALCNLMEKMRL